VNNLRQADDTKKGSAVREGRSGLIAPGSGHKKRLKSKKAVPGKGLVAEVGESVATGGQHFQF